MAHSDIKIALDKHFQDNWTDTAIQFHGQNLDTVGLDDFISLIYSPVENETIGFNGTATGRIQFVGLYKVFCYAKNPTKALILADHIKSFLNGLEIDLMYVNIGQDGFPKDLGNGLFEVLVNFTVEEWSYTPHSENYLIENYGLTDEEGNFLTDEDGTYLLQEF